MKNICLILSLTIICFGSAIHAKNELSSLKTPTPPVDLRLPTIEHPHALCAGPGNKFVVTVGYGNGTVIQERIKVVLHVIQGGEVKEYTKSIAGISGGYSTKVYFTALIKNQGKVKIRAIVNSDQKIDEVTYDNNNKTSEFNVTKKCVGIRKAPLIVKTYNPNYSKMDPRSPILGAEVVVKQGTHQLRGMSGPKGIAQIGAVAPGGYKIFVKKKGCKTYVKSYQMPKKKSTVNIPLKCTSPK